RVGVEVEDRADVAELKARQWARRAAKLLARLILVIAVEVDVAERLHELARPKPAFVGDLHALDLGDVPGRDDEPAGIGVSADLVYHPGDLIVCSPIRSLPRAPLFAVDRAEIAIRVGPLVPDGNAMRLEIGDIGVASQEPDELAQDRLDVQLFSGDERKAKGQIEAKLP